MQITPTQSDIQTALRNFLLGVLPAGVDVVAGQGNRVPEPQAGSFVVMTPIRFNRPSTNLDTYADVVFDGTTSGTTLTVSTLIHGSVVTTNNLLFGVGVSDGVKILSQLSGLPGGTGNYLLSAPQTISPAQKLAAGYELLQQNAEVTVQLDFHSADLTAGDMAQITSTALRDLYATDVFRKMAPPFNGVVPLHADDPRQVPFINENQQWEWRWVLEACLQANQVALTPQQFAEALKVRRVAVDAFYPA